MRRDLAMIWARSASDTTRSVDGVTAGIWLETEARGPGGVTAVPRLGVVPAAPGPDAGAAWVPRPGVVVTGVPPAPPKIAAAPEAPAGAGDTEAGVAGDAGAGVVLGAEAGVALGAGAGLPGIGVTTGAAPDGK